MTQHALLCYSEEEEEEEEEEDEEEEEEEEEVCGGGSGSICHKSTLMQVHTLALVIASPPSTPIVVGRTTTKSVWPSTTTIVKLTHLRCHPTPAR